MSTSEYDGQGRRIVKAVTNSAGLDCTYHYYFRGQSVIEERNGSNAVLKQYVWGLTYIDELVQTAINGDPVDDPDFDPEDPDHDFRGYFALSNANYNVMALIDDSGGLVERYEYTPYGERTVYFSSGGDDPLAMSPTANSRRATLAGPVSAPYGLLAVGHQGLFHDEESGLIYNRARMRRGAFLQRDRWEYIDRMNLTAPYWGRWQTTDPTGDSCQVWYNCYLVSSSTTTFQRHCEYQCVEDTTKPRKDRAGGVVDCSDPRVPTIKTADKTFLRCKSCPTTITDSAVWDDRPYSPTNCSRAQCRQDVANQAAAMRRTCTILPKPAKSACKAAAKAYEQAALPLCDLCKDP